jgi:cytochrome b pre-mRNA-processing protein 3
MYLVSQRSFHSLAKPLTAAVAVVVVSIGALLWLWGGDAERKAIGRLPLSERQALYQRTLVTLRASCDPGKRPSGLDEFCRQQAKFLIQFPECDAACTKLVRSQRREPTR